MKNTAFWFRRDLRLSDNRALHEALGSGHQVICFFVFDSHILSKIEDEMDARVGFIYHSIQNIKSRLQMLGSDLVIGHGKPEELWPMWIKQYQLNGIYFNRDYESYAKSRDEKIKEICIQQKITFHSFKDHIIFESNEVRKSDGTPYTIFTPFKNAWLNKIRQIGVEECFKDYSINLPHSPFLKFTPTTLMDLKDLGFLPARSVFPSSKIDQSIIKKYSISRDFPHLDATSKMGIHLRFGTIGIRELLREVWQTDQTYVSELIWREFYSYILQSFPHVEFSSFKKAYDQIKWVNNESQFQAWCEGKTGYPMVDAGMRELNNIGLMHNRLRMITASFLVKHLLIDWRWGEAYFAKKLLDFDLASNNGGWQWAAGSGTDAAPYFRIFNPTAQQKKFDPQFEYIKKWVPEFDSQSYPNPVIDHEFARKRCLEVYKTALRIQLEN
ncbi:MAG: deoxyribodipyrimidine photo-lyase [Saprospiraceae bacterium]|nr:deoxyribodipyrimidine photo-lyase [Saprospiraceae bacterium]